jgi:zinc protease
VSFLTLCATTRWARRFFLAALLLAVLPASPRAAVFDPQTFTLENGLQVVVVTNHRSPVVVHMIWYRAGAADEPPGKSGVAHFLEHLMFRGTKTVPPGEFSRIVARNGGNDNAFTSHDYTGYYQKIAKDRLELVMGLEADRMSNLALDANIVAAEREVILEERRARIDNDPAAMLAEELAATLYLNSPYRIPVIGWEGEIRGLGPADMRAFYRRFYAPNNAILVIAGDVTADEVRPLVEKHYGAIPSRALPPRARPAEPARHASRRLVLKSERVRQPSWRRGYLAPSYLAGGKQHAYALEVLAELLGSGHSSRLYQQLVVKTRLAAFAGAYYDPTAVGRTSFSIHATPAPGVAVEKVAAEVDAVLARLLAEGVDPNEVERAQRRLQASAVYARDRLDSAARILGEALIVGESVEDIESWPQRIGAVTPEQVDAAARAVLLESRAVTGILLPLAPAAGVRAKGEGGTE